MASFHWLWENEVAPLDPMDADVLSAYFPGRGLVVLRTGWDVSDVMFSIEAGPYYDVIHNQADKGHFTFYGLGGRWAIDSGYGNMGPSAPTGRDQTIAHNSVLVMDRGQALSGAGTGTNGKILSYEETAVLSYILVDVTEAYTTNSKGTRHLPMGKAIRHAVYVKPGGGVVPYVIIADDIELSMTMPVNYQWLLHTEVGYEVAVDERGATIHSPDTEAFARLEVLILR